MDLSKFDFHLPDELIARYPAKNRDESRLLVLNKQTKSIVFENVFKNIENFYCQMIF